MQKQISVLVVLILFSLLGGCSGKPPRASEAELGNLSHLALAEQGLAENCCQQEGTQFAVAAGGANAPQLGAQIFKQGGNFIDALVATAFGIAVEATPSAGIGGGGFALIHLADGSDLFLDFRETAPQATKASAYFDANGAPIPEASVRGGKAIATPGFVRGLYQLHRRFGKLPWRQVLQPAADLARNGFTADRNLKSDITDGREILRRDPTLAKVFLNADSPQNQIVQTDLAKTIELIGKEGDAVFYRGSIAKKLVTAVRKANGFLSATDLQNYQPKWRTPLHGRWRQYSFVTAPPPSAGGVILSQVFAVLEKLPPHDWKADPVGGYSRLVEILKRSYADRSQFIAVPDFIATNYENLLLPQYIEQIALSVAGGQNTPAEKIRPGTVSQKEGKDTTHISVMDASGNAASCTITINGGWGSGLVAPGTGILLNNEMDDFALKAGQANIYGLTSAENNVVAPGRRPVSSMTPTILFSGTKPVLAVGAAGGSRIITGVLQTILNYELFFDRDLRKSVFAPRLHHQWQPDKIELESGISPKLKKGLSDREYQIADPPYAVRVQAVGWNDSRKKFEAVFDPRDSGGAAAQ